MTTASDDFLTGDRLAPCCWCATPMPPDVVWCRACGHNTSDVRGCSCPTCTARAGQADKETRRSGDKETAREGAEVSSPGLRVSGSPCLASRVLVLRRDPDRTWRGEPGSAAIFADRGQVVARTADDLLGLAIKCWSAGISLLLNHDLPTRAEQS
jgi:hypothetical protein